MARAYIWEAKEGLFYRVSTRTARATQKNTAKTNNRRIKTKSNLLLGATETVQHLRALVLATEDLGLVFSTYRIAHNYLQFKGI